MTFHAKERILLFNLLPVEGDILSLRIVRKLREALSFSEEENAALKMQQTGQRWVWDQSADQPKEIEIGPKAQSLIADA